MNMNNLAVGILILVGLTFCEKKKMDYSEIEAMKVNLPDVSYPYKLEPGDALSLVLRAESLKVGASYQRVLETLGHPNEINWTYDKDNWSKIVGFSFVFLLQRDRPNGSAVEKNERAIRIHFDTLRTITRIHVPSAPR